jgi:hypothetical protein
MTALVQVEVAGDPRRLPELRHGLREAATTGGPWFLAEFSRLLGDGPPEGIAVDQAVNAAVNAADNHIGWVRRSLDNAQLMHVTADMCDVLYASLDSMPDDFVLTEGVPSRPYGLVVFAKPYFGIDAGDHDNTVRVDAIVWGLVNLPLRNRDGDDTPEWQTTPAVRPGFGFYALRWVDGTPDDARSRDALERLPAALRTWWPLGRSDWAIGDRVADTVHDGIDPTSRVHASMVDDRRLMTALWSIVRQTQVVATTTVVADRAAQRRLDRSGSRAERTVQVIHLRRREYMPRGEQPGDGRRVRVRFAVRPFWRNQACGPGWSQRRLILVPAHFRGPTDAPLTRIERIWNLDR